MPLLAVNWRKVLPFTRNLQTKKARHWRSIFPDARAEAARLRREIEASLQPGAWKFAQETGRRLNLEQVVAQW